MIKLAAQRLTNSRFTILASCVWVGLFALGCNEEGPAAEGGAGTMSSAAGTSAGAGGAAGAAGSGAAGSGAAGAGVAGSGASGRIQDTRTFTYDAAMAEFAALPDSTVEADRYFGVLDGAGYQIEVPKTWNGILVMYAHGYGGTGNALRITTLGAGLRKHILEQGYAWAASSYTKNYYDVRAGVEDTNKLALAFKRIVGEKGRTVDEPAKRYLIGHSMGGHVTGAAIEKEAQETAANKVKYAGAVPMCGVLGDTELFNYFTAYQFAAHQLSNVPVPTAPVADFMPIRMQMRDALFSTYPTVTTPAGDKLKTIVENLTGGARPNFALGFASMMWQDAVWNTFGGDGKVSGILERQVTDTTKVVYQLDSDAAVSAEEKAFNDAVYRVTAEPEANPKQPDGVRWVPVVNGEFDIPVVAIHTLGDLYVPFSMEQIYRRRADAKGSAALLVQRAIRGTGHCEFTAAEQIDAFDAMAKWEQEGVKPEGDDVLDPAVVGAPDYGCKFTKNTFTAAEMATVAPVRMAAPACP